MRANLKHFLARVALISLITLGLNVRLFAHDLPADRSLAEAVTEHCFTSGSATVPPQPAINKLWKQFSQTVATLSTMWTRTQNLLDSTSFQPKFELVIAPSDAGVAPRPSIEVPQVATEQTQNSLDSTSFQHESLLVIAPPDAGVAPRPSSNVLPVATERTQPAKAGEVYMPYDFRLSDWRFGQFPYHGKTASAPRPTTLPSLAGGFSSIPSLAIPSIAEIESNPPTRQNVALGGFLQQVERWQCSTCAALSNGAALTRSADVIAESIEHFVTACRSSLLDGKPAPSLVSSPGVSERPAPQSNDLIGPQFVVYDTTVGGHIVLTLAQARAWQLEMPQAQSRLTELLSAGLKPIQTSVLATATDGLQFAGQTLLNLSRSLSSISEPRVASGPQANHR